MGYGNHLCASLISSPFGNTNVAPSTGARPISLQVLVDQRWSTFRQEQGKLA
jgi:hypothetical protein